ncbi:4787_t:CDS:2 [Paraglomus occultum]|uniref:4787_t:CDS:1 n=1 Tax=Paraglomus occultum TaxID=144539 RepID=A0A9N9C2Z2_9GLOM|nr:4787_t:CDS:2 [Paraglomus occultum]
MSQVNDEYAVSERTHSYRRRSFSDRDERKNHTSRHHHHSPPPPHTHHQPVMKFNADFWKQVGKQEGVGEEEGKSSDFKRNVMKALFKEERFKEFQKRRCMDQVMDVDDDDDEWLEQQQLIHNIVQNQWQSASVGMYPTNIPNELDVQQQQLILQQQAAYVEHLPTEIAQAVVQKKLPPEFYTYRQDNSQQII